MIQFLRQKLKPLKLRYFDEAWNIGFLTNPIEQLLAGEQPQFVWLQHDYTDRWFADPFILRQDNEHIYLLVEEFYLPTRKGRIAQLKVEKQHYRLVETKVVLETPTHLSFPCIFRQDNRLLMLPENYRSNTFWVYQYDEITEIFKPLRQVSAHLLADAILTTCFGNALLFATKFPKPSHQTLDVYRYDIANHCYSWQTTARFNENIARNAGDFFKVNHQIYRPAQECNKYYGHGLSIQKVEQNDMHFTFQEVLRLQPPRQSPFFGIHTFNYQQGITVVDGKYFAPSGLSFLIHRVIEVLKRIHII